MHRIAISHVFLFERVKTADSFMSRTYDRLLLRTSRDTPLSAVHFVADTLWTLLTFRDQIAMTEYGIVAVPPTFANKPKGIDLRRLQSHRAVQTAECERGAVSPSGHQTGRLGLSDSTLRRAIRSSGDTLIWLFQLLPLVAANEDLSRALLFFQESQRLYSFQEPAEVLEMMFLHPIDSQSTVYKESDFGPGFGPHLARLELSFLSAYRAIEAVIGDPPKNERRFAETLQKRGFNPDEKLKTPGWPEESLRERIRFLNCVRDKKVGHGSRTGHQGALQYGELLAAQECAQRLLTAILQALRDSKKPHASAPSAT
jgi:hypothetical protein